MDITKLVDGNRELTDQENDVATFENLNNCLLVSFQKNAGNGSEKMNMAKFFSLALGSNVPTLSLVAAPSTTSIGELVAQHPGEMLIFVSEVFVEGKAVSIAGFRKGP